MFAQERYANRNRKKPRNGNSSNNNINNNKNTSSIKNLKNAGKNNSEKNLDLLDETLGNSLKIFNNNGDGSENLLKAAGNELFKNLGDSNNIINGGNNGNIKRNIKNFPPRKPSSTQKQINSKNSKNRKFSKTTTNTQDRHHPSQPHSARYNSSQDRNGGVGKHRVLISAGSQTARLRGKEVLQRKRTWHHAPSLAGGSTNPRHARDYLDKLSIRTHLQIKPNFSSLDKGDEIAERLPRKVQAVQDRQVLDRLNRLDNTTGKKSGKPDALPGEQVHFAIARKMIDAGLPKTAVRRSRHVPPAPPKPLKKHGNTIEHLSVEEIRERKMQRQKVNKTSDIASTKLSALMKELPGVDKEKRVHYQPVTSKLNSGLFDQHPTSS